MHANPAEVELRLEVVERRAIADSVSLVSLRAAGGGTLPVWTPGAHIDLDLGPGLVRQYSLCGDPGRPEVWEVAALLQPQSLGGSAQMHALTPGTRLTGRGPRNHFPLRPAGSYLFVAGGIGVTPLVPMVHEVSRRGIGWRMVYGGRTRGAMAFADTLLDEYGDRVMVVPEDELGLLPLDEVLGATGPDTATYCCGPESLVSATERIHAEHGRGSLHVERFTPKTQAEPGGDQPDQPFEVEAVRSGKVVRVAEDETILDALHSAGVRVLSSCTEGICGTCEVSVLSGRPDHRDSILSRAEQEASATMFPCVSRSLSPRLVLDV